MRSAERPDGKGSTVRILTVDDDPMITRLLRDVLSSRGDDVVTAENGEQAWDLIEHGSFDLLITDWMMPKLDGPGLIQRVTGAALPSYLYIIVLSVRNAGDDEADLLEIGADDYITKPATRRELLARVALAERFLQLLDGSKMPKRPAA